MRMWLTGNIAFLSEYHALVREKNTKQHNHIYVSALKVYSVPLQQRLHCLFIVKQKTFTLMNVIRMYVSLFSINRIVRTKTLNCLAISRLPRRNDLRLFR